MNYREEDKSFQLFIKPTGHSCNLACSYCYYASGITENLESGIMPDEILEAAIRNQFEAYPSQDCFFSWHGGEPLLAGKEFYSKAFELQLKYSNGKIPFGNGIQTNGTLIDADWCSFFKEANFCVGVSIDGPETIHNRFRKGRAGQLSYGKTFSGLKMLLESGIKTEILTVIGKHNQDSPKEVYSFLRETGVRYLTFIPLVETHRDKGITDMSVEPRKFGEFLCTVFNEWVENDIGNIKIQIIEEAVRTAFGQDHTLCIFKKHCGRVPVLEKEGSIFACDHFTDDHYRRGNILNTHLGDLLESENQVGFGILKESTLPDCCRRCDVLAMCNGECPKNRIISAPDGTPGLNYLCEGYKMFFRHIRPFAEAVRQQWVSSI